MNSYNYYDILNVLSTASYEDIKKSYQSLILIHHPDKSLSTAAAAAVKSSPTSSTESSSHCNIQQTLSITNDDDEEDNNKNDTFIQINEAWNILRDPAKRRVYDAEIFQDKFSELPDVVHEELTQENLLDHGLDENDQQILGYICRCGNNCRVLAQIIKTQWKYNVCDECSHCVEINI